MTYGHSGGGRNPVRLAIWTPDFAGVTNPAWDMS